MKKISIGLLLLLVLLTFTSIVSARQGRSESTGIIPATPPVNVNTSRADANYKGYGYLRFNVTLPLTSYPEFTLGGDEDAEYELGDAEYASQSLVYISDGELRSHRSSESGWLLGIIDASLVDNTFTKDGVTFNLSFDQSGYLFGKRSTVAKRLGTAGSIIIDYAYTSLWAVFSLSGNTRMASIGPDTYISDYDEDIYGLVYRPMITLQPTISLGDRFDFIPFVGASAFLTVSYSSWEVNEWEDALYGKDCFDGCPDSGIFGGIIPVETFVGFDLEFHITKSDTLSLSSFISAGIATDTESMSELYIVYSRSLEN